MAEKQTLSEHRDVEELSNELTYRGYLMNRGKVRSLFQKIKIPEYLALHAIASEGQKSVIYSGRTYLADLAEKMQLTIRQTSRVAGNLKEKGLVNWSHDGNGSEGTYVIITETGQKLLEEQEQVLKKYYSKVIERFGKEDLIQVLQAMKQLETVMNRTMEEMGLGDADDGNEELDD